MTAICAQLAALDEGNHLRCRGFATMSCMQAADQIDHALHRALVRNVLYIDAGGALEQLAAQMRRAAIAGGRKQEFRRAGALQAR